MILGVSKVLNEIPSSSKIIVHSPANIGFKYIENILQGKSVRKWTNKDVGALLAASIKDNKHKVSFSNYGELESTEFTKSIKSRLKNRFRGVSQETVPNQIFEVTGNVYNKNDLATTDVSIFVRGACDFASEDRDSCYYVILNYKGFEKEITKKFKHSTPNRMILQGVIDSIKLLKKPCHIKLFTHSAFGMVKFNKYQKGVNNDLLKELFDLLARGSHSLEEIISMQRQEELKEKIINNNYL